MITLAILGNIGGMYSESPDLHAASPLHQCFSLEDLDRYCSVVGSRMSADIRVCLFLVWPWGLRRLLD